MIEACAQLPVELDIVEGVPHTEARERYARADIVVDQLNAGWHGVFALEAMALGKPVVSHLKPDVVERSAEGFGVRVPIVPATKETLVDALRPLVEDAALRRELGAASRAYVEQVHDIDRIADRLIDIYAQLCTWRWRSELSAARHAVCDLRPRRPAVAADRDLPAPALHRLPRHGRVREARDDLRLHGRAHDPAAARDHERVLPLLLRLRRRRADRLLVVRTSFWFTMGMATLGLVVGLALADPIARSRSTSTATSRSSAPASSGSGRR